jgi:hypothetical protein
MKRLIYIRMFVTFLIVLFLAYFSVQCKNIHLFKKNIVNRTLDTNYDKSFTLDIFTSFKLSEFETMDSSNLETFDNHKILRLQRKKNIYVKQYNYSDSSCIINIGNTSFIVEKLLSDNIATPVFCYLSSYYFLFNSCDYYQFNFMMCKQLTVPYQLFSIIIKDSLNTTPHCIYNGYVPFELPEKIINDFDGDKAIDILEMVNTEVDTVKILKFKSLINNNFVTNNSYSFKLYYNKRKQAYYYNWKEMKWPQYSLR